MDLSGYSVNKSTIEERQHNLRYIRLLYALLALELVIALVWTSFCLGYWDDLGKPIVHWWEFGIVAGVLVLILILVTFFVEAVRRFPINWVIYLIFTLAFAHLWAFLCCLDESRLLYYALWLLTAIAIGFALYAFCATFYMQSMESALVILGASGIVFMAWLAFTEISWFLLLLVYVAVAVFGFYLAFNLRLMVRHSVFDSEEEDPISGAVRVWIESALVFCRFGELGGRMFKRPVYSA